MRKKRTIKITVERTIMCSTLTMVMVFSLFAAQSAYAEEAEEPPAAAVQTQSPPPATTTKPTVDGLKNELSNVREDLDQAKGEYDAAVKELKELETKIAILEEQIRIKEGEIETTQGQIEENDALLVRLWDQIAELDNEIIDHNSALNQRLRIMYQTSDHSMLAVLLGSESFVDFLTNLEMVRRIHESDKAFLEELEEKLNLVESKKDQAQQIEMMLESQRAALQTQKDLLDEDKAALAIAQQRVKEIRDKAAAEIARLEEESKRIQQELLNMTSKWGDYHGGAMAWPVLGPVTSGYGNRVHPITGRWTMHTGIDIGIPYGTPVHAGNAGVVIYSGWNSGGYGYLVMIDHGVDTNGNMIVTMYAHNQSNAVGVGSIVNRGDIIAYAGSTGMSNGPHVHFEVRVNGAPTNPMGWLG
jgi:murein DD-endopeptidase MepM/ murein hydrolase activator NlpD